MALLDRLHTSSYSSSSVTMAVSCTIFEIKRDIGRKTAAIFHTPLVFNLHVDALSIFAKDFNTNCPIPGLLGCAKILPKSSSLCLGRNNVTDRQTDRETTDRQTTDGRLMP